MRRLAILLALLSSGTIAFVAPAPVSADTSVVEPEPVARIFAPPSSPQTTGPSSLQPPYNEVPWNLDRIDQRTTTGNNSFSFSNLGSGVDVYVVDTGINATHPEFDGRVLDGWSYRADDDSLAAYEASRAAYNPNTKYGIPPCATNSSTQQFVPSTYDAPVSRDTADTGKVDNNGHGTHVAGSIGGNYTGVAKGVNLIPVRVLDSCGNGNFTMIYSGLLWILANHAAGVPAVVNLSLGFPSPVQDIDDLIGALIAEGVIVVAASGNIEDNTDLGEACGTTPAGTPGTISVGSSNEADNESSFSYYGDCVDIFAPGELIVSTWPKYGASMDTYRLDTGTSMAAPQIVGAVARFVQGTTVTSSTPAAAWAWLKLNATCNAIKYYTPASNQPSRTNRAKTPNRLLAIDVPATTPCAPASVTASGNNGTVTVDWSPVASDNGSATLDYKVTLTPGDHSCTKTPSQVLKCVFTGLTRGIIYSASVYARNAIGNGVVVSSTPVLPKAVAGLFAVVNKNELDVSWVRAGGDEDGVTYTATATPGGATCTSISTNCSISGLTLGAEYTVTVVGANLLGDGTSASIMVKFVRAPLPVTNLTASAADNALDISWEKGSGEAATTKYTATATPGNFTCTTSSTTCSIESLINGTEYSVSVVGVNDYGTGAATTVKGTPDGVPDVPSIVQSVLSKRTIKLSWPAVTSTAKVTYVVSSRPGNLMCTTELPTCEVTGLSYGVDYSFVITTRSATGLTSSAVLTGSARPGFKVKMSVVKRGSSTLLTSFLSPLSKGKRSWSETGPCSIRGTKFIAPKKATKCILILKVARKGSYPAMSTRLSVTVK